MLIAGGGAVLLLVGVVLAVSGQLGVGIGVVACSAARCWSSVSWPVGADA